MRRNYSNNQHIKFRLAKKFRRDKTPAENILWSRLRGNRLMDLHFRRQHVIHGFIVDFYCHTARLVVELDGGIHRSQIEADAMRDDILNNAGLTVLHLPNEIVEKDPEAAVQTIREMCLRQIPDITTRDSISSE
jgi:very-short-patch-repair endonuclease